MSSPCTTYSQCGWVATCFSAFLAFTTALSFFIYVAFNAISAAIAGSWNLPATSSPTIYIGLLPPVLVPSLGAWFGSSILNDFIAWILKAFLCNDIESIQNEVECENVNQVFKTALNAFYLMFFLALLALFISVIIFFEVRFGTTTP